MKEIRKDRKEKKRESEEKIVLGIKMLFLFFSLSFVLLLISSVLYGQREERSEENGTELHSYAVAQVNQPQVQGDNVEYSWESFEEAATSMTTALIYAWHNLVCRWHGKYVNPRINEWHYDASQCSPSPYIPFSEYRELGIKSFFIRGDTYFPVNSTLCADLLQFEDMESVEDVDLRQRMIECLKRHNVPPEDIPPTKLPPNVLPPPPTDEPYTMFSLREGDKNFEVDPRIALKGKVGHPGFEPFWRRAIGIRISAGGLQTVETSIEGYLNQIVSCRMVNGSVRNVTKLNCEANRACMQTLSNNHCRSCCASDGSCHPDDPAPNNWCNAGQCPPGAGAGPSSPCPSGVPCPTFAGCDQNNYACMDIPLAGDCATYDQFPCDTRNSCGRYISNDGQCIYLSQGWGGQIDIQLADCPNRANFSCVPFTSSCGDDGLIVDTTVGSTYLEIFLRVANYDPDPAPSCAVCNTTDTEETCGSDCGQNQTCSCKCCSGSQAGCGLLNWPPGCPCCDSYIRLRFDLTGSPAVIAYNLAFLLFGPVSVPYMTACGIQATSFRGSHPGEWLDLCACNQDVWINNYDSNFCDFGALNLCGIIVDIIENFQSDRVKCMVHEQLNDLIGGAVKGALASALPISLMEEMGACGFTGWDIGVYPEFCAGGSLGYSWNYSNGGAGIVLFSDATARLTARASCVEQEGGTCPQYPAQVLSTPCKTNPQLCFPNAGGYNLGIYVDQEFINELLYIFWARGFLCFDFNLPWDIAKVIIPGIRQIVTTPEDVVVEFKPVCGPSLTPQFYTSGSNFYVVIPRLKLRFRTQSTNIQLFDIGMRLTLQGQLGWNATTCHPADTLCPTNPTFRCQVCNITGCSWQNIPYGPGYFIVSNVVIDPQVTDISNRHPSIGTPANTDIADVIVTMLDGIINNTQLTTRMYDLLGLLPIRLNQINFFGFAQRSFLIRYNMNPFCINFILDFGNFTPSISDMLEKGVLTPGPSIDKLASSPEFDESEDIDRPEIDTIVSVEGTDAPRIKFYSSSPTFIHLRIPSDGRVRFRVMHEVRGFFPDETTQRIKYFWWPKSGGLFWHEIKGDTFEFRPIRRVEEIEVFAAVEEFSEEKGGPFYRIVDSTPVRIRVEKGIEGELLGPRVVEAGKSATFEVKSEFDVERVSFSLDGINWSEFVEGSDFSFVPQEAGKIKLFVIFESGDYTGYLEKEITVEGTVYDDLMGGCGKFGIAGFFGIFGFILSWFAFIGAKRRKNGKK